MINKGNIKFNLGLTEDGRMVKQDGSNIFIGEYEVTTVEEFRKALLENKLIFVKKKDGKSTDGYEYWFMNKLYGTIDSAFTMSFTHAFGTVLKSLSVAATNDGRFVWVPQPDVNLANAINDITNNRNYYPSVLAVTKYVDEQIQKALGNK